MPAHAPNRPRTRVLARERRARRLIAATAWLFAGAAALVLARSARADEHAAAPAPAPAAATAPAPAAEPAPKPARRSAEKPALNGSGAVSVADPMDVVRERLAQRLSVIKPAENANPNLLRVVSKPAAGAGDASPPPAANAAEGAARAGAVRPGPSPRVIAGGHAARPAAEAAHDPLHWDYDGAGGPSNWGRMNADYAKCSSGTRQSPIDIREGIRVELDPVQFDYKPSAFRVIDNGHTVQVNVAPGNTIDVMGQQFQLVQFHFHRPSEERIDGKAYDMVVHLVHKSLEGKLAVVAVLLEKGSAQPVVQSVWNNLPLEKNSELAARAPIDLNQLLPAARGYFTYMGSLTTPPCSEGVLWMVMKQPVTISPEQIGIFARLYPMNARPIQQAAGRLIKESN